MSQNISVFIHNELFLWYDWLGEEDIVWCVVTMYLLLVLLSRCRFRNTKDRWNKESRNLQAFDFCVGTINDENTKPRFERKLVEVKFNGGICTKLCLKLWFESDWYFYNIAESRWFWKRLFRNKVPNNPFLNSIWKSNCPEAHCGTLDRYGKQPAKILTLCLRRLGGCFLS